MKKHYFYHHALKTKIFNSLEQHVQILIGRPGMNIGTKYGIEDICVNKKKKDKCECVCVSTCTLK